jgi:hypothetical protein
MGSERSRRRALAAPSSRRGPRPRRKGAPEQIALGSNRARHGERSEAIQESSGAFRPPGSPRRFAPHDDDSIRTQRAVAASFVSSAPPYRIVGSFPRRRSKRSRSGAAAANSRPNCVRVEPRSSLRAKRSNPGVVGRLTALDRRVASLLAMTIRFERSALLSRPSVASSFRRESGIDLGGIA